VPLLTDAPVGRHFAQLHRNPAALSEAVGAFLETGLRQGSSVVVLACPAHTALLLGQLEASRLHPAAMQSSGQLTVLDAETTLAKFMREGMPHWSEFRLTIGGVLDRAGMAGRTTRVYSELANVLWTTGPHASIRLEEFWNALGRLYPFSMYCAYMLDPHCEASYAGPVEEIGRTHTDILGTVEDERFGAALDVASREVFGIALSQMIGYSSSTHEGERRFPSGQRTLLWVRRNLPSSSASVLERAHKYFQQPAR
jgi:hypothetical protein